MILELGSGRMIPGFEDGIVRHAAGDKKALESDVSRGLPQEDLQGAAVEFDITVKEVKERWCLRPWTKSLFASYGVEEGGEETVP